MPVETEVRAPRAHETRARILESAVATFAEHGFDGASTRDIARRAATTQQLVGYHFGAKEELWRAAVASVFDDAGARLAGLVDSVGRLDVSARAEAVIREFVALSADRPEINRIVLQEAKAGGDRMTWLVDRYVRPFYDLVAGLVEELADAVSLPTADPLHLYYVLTGAGAMVFAAAPECEQLTGRSPVDPDVVQAHADCLVALLLDRPGAPPPPAPAPRRRTRS